MSHQESGVPNKALRKSDNGNDRPAERQQTMADELHDSDDERSFRIPLAPSSSQRHMTVFPAAACDASVPLGGSSLHVKDSSAQSVTSSIGSMAHDGDDSRSAIEFYSLPGAPSDDRVRNNDRSEYHHDGSERDDDEDVLSVSSGSNDKSRSQNGGTVDDEDSPDNSKGVTRVRFVTFAVLFFSIFGISAAMYISSRRGEVEQFELQFDDHANAIIDAYSTHWYQAITAMDSFVLSMPSDSVDDGDGIPDNASDRHNTWPTKFIPHFASRAAALRNVARFVITAVMPLVPDDQRLAYEEFALRTHSQWISAGIQYEIDTNQAEWKFGNILQNGNTEGGSDEGRRRRLRQLQADSPCSSIQQPRVDASPGIVRRIYTLDVCGPVYEADGASDFYIPIWQHSPVDFAFVNYNLYNDLAFGPAIRHAVSTKTMVVSNARFLNEEINTTVTTNAAHAPSSTIYFPILENGNDLVGIISGSIYWDAYMQVNDMPETADGINIVLTNGYPCNQAYTFEVRGPDVVYLSEGDLHDSDFEEYGTSFQMSEEQTDSILSFTNVRVDLDYCPYTIHIFPSQKVLDRYRTNLPIYYTILVVGVLLLTSIVFVGYDVLVERRQRTVMNTAVKSQAIVSSLFPKNVRKRLMEDAPTSGNGDNVAGAGAQPVSPLVSQKARLKSFISNNGGSGLAQLSASAATNSRSGRPRYSNGTTESITIHKSAPIADLFPNSTVLFADIAGFTAWSSVREPSHVFTLLETVYGAFDRIADRRKVFKVETIGDCYVAATGLPDPQKDHTVIMAKFAGEILCKMTDITGQLEMELGPDTTSLQVRVGLHSGPVTAGVLRGQKSRFQLFGDTVNMASRMESNGRPSFIQCSQETADELIVARKGHWVKRRDDIVSVKGKGDIQTFWVFPKGMMTRRRSGTIIDIADASGHSDDASADDLSKIFPSTSSNGSATESMSRHSRTIDSAGQLSPPLTQHLTANNPNNSNSNSNSAVAAARESQTKKYQRLIDWNVDILLQLLKRVLAQREILKVERSTLKNRKPMNMFGGNGLSSISTPNGDASSPESRTGTVSAHPLRRMQSLDKVQADKPSDSFLGMANPRAEYAESIRLPRFEQTVAPLSEVDTEHITLPEAVSDQLRDYVTRIAGAYQMNNPFHNFSHASHVTMSANKILDRVVSADDFVVESTSLNRVAAKLHDYTYGITSDPLTHFACVFSALVHDVDHPGVSNAQLIKEQHEMALAYKNKSVAEQNSLDLAWGLLMDASFDDLRRYLFANDTDRKRFRQLLLNSVMATDIFDPELNEMRNRRWQKAFHSLPVSASNKSEDSRDSTVKIHDLDSTARSVSSATAASVSSQERQLRLQKREHQSNEDASELADRRATIVIEHIIQAADVAHTMQHWHVYQKWNRRLFHEMYLAYKNGRMDKDPSVGWYRGELWFYDNYIIPLAKKLSDCGVFGVSSDEFLNYAKMNRSEWERKGEDIVLRMKKEVEEGSMVHAN